jgi:hypothetical protein
LKISLDSILSIVSIIDMVKYDHLIGLNNNRVCGSARRGPSGWECEATEMDGRLIERASVASLRLATKWLRDEAMAVKVLRCKAL